jgi:hypothetical protein
MKQEILRLSTVLILQWGLHGTLYSAMNFYYDCAAVKERILMKIILIRVSLSYLHEVKLKNSASPLVSLSTHNFKNTLTFLNSIMTVVARSISDIQHLTADVA